MFVPFEGVWENSLRIGTTWPALASRRAVEPLLRYAPQSFDSTFNVNLQKRNYTTQYADGMNLYQYCLGNPAIAVDPQGTVVVVISGLGEEASKGYPMGEAVRSSIGSALSNQLYDTDPEGANAVEVKYLGGGGDGPMNETLDEYRAYVNRKTADPCSLEQFVVVGHSDGATALYKLLRRGELDDPVAPSAYVAMVDLVRLDFGLLLLWPASVPDSNTRHWRTWVDNFYQHADLAFRGKSVKGVDIDSDKTDVAEAHWKVTGSSKLRGPHFAIWETPAVIQEIKWAAAGHYGFNVTMDMTYNRRPIPWDRNRSRQSHGPSYGKW
jgi:hypothetical protein